MKNFTRLSTTMTLVLVATMLFAQGTFQKTYTTVTQEVQKPTVNDSKMTDPNGGAVTDNTTAFLLNESFESTTFPPTGWTVSSPDGGTGWERLTAGTAVPGWGGGTIVAKDGNASAFCTWSTGGVSSNDQWLISPQVTGITAGDSLSFWIHKYFGYIDSLDVKISTTNNTVASFTILVDDIGFADSVSGWFYFSYPLGSYTGQSIYIAFREHVLDNFNNGDAFSLDLIRVGTPPADDIGVSALVNPVTGALTAAESVTVKIDNHGTASQTNFSVSYEFNMGTAVTEVYIGTIPGGGSANHTFSVTVDMSNIATYGFKCYTGLSGDEDASNDTIWASVNNTGGSTQMWDLQFALNVDSITGGQGLAGCEYDGSNFYVAEWGYSPPAPAVQQKQVFKVSLAGALIDSFDATSFTTGLGILDMAWDDQYLYGGNNANTIYCFTGTGTLITTITSPATAISMAYDEVNDAFWVNDWANDLNLISRSGNVVNVILAPPSLFGSAYDDNSAGGPFLWLYTGTSGSTVSACEQMNLLTGTLTGVSHTVTTDFPAANLAGGMFTSGEIITNEYTLGGYDQGAGILFGYFLDMLVSTPEIEAANLNISVYPNPSTGIVNVYSDSRIEAIDVMSLSGQTVFSTEVKAERKSLNLGHLSHGVYFIRIETENGISIEKVTLR